MHLSSSHPDPLQHTVDLANAAIRRYLRQLPGGRLNTVEQRSGYEHLVAEFNAAVRRLHAARDCEQGVAAELVLTA